MKLYKLEAFMKEYAKALAECRELYPHEYKWKAELLPLVVNKMRTAIKQGDYEIGTRAIKLTCKRLGIKNSYPSVNRFLKEECENELA